MSSKRKQVTLAIAGSVGIHLFVLFAWALSVQWFPTVQAAPNQPPEEIKLQVVEDKPTETPAPELKPILKAPTPKLVFNDAEDLPEASAAPKDAAFQSDRNTEAASEMPPTGDKPLPSQTGRKVPYFAFDTHPSIPGDEGTNAGQNMPPPILATAPPPPRAVSTPMVKATPPPTPAPSDSTTTDPRDLAMVTPKSIPSAPAEAEPNPYDPSFRPPVGMTEPPRPTPVPRQGGSHTFQQRTDASGNIAISGVSSVASEASPAGRYVAVVKRAANLRYTKYVDTRGDIIRTGYVRVRFIVDREGKVSAARVVSSNADEVLASVSLRAVTEASIPPMPPEVVAVFDGGILDMSINFTLEDAGN